MKLTQGRARSWPFWAGRRITRACLGAAAVAGTGCLVAALGLTAAIPDSARADDSPLNAYLSSSPPELVAGRSTSLTPYVAPYSPSATIDWVFDDGSTISRPVYSSVDHTFTAA